MLCPHNYRITRFRVSAQNASVKIFPDIKKQVIQSIGGNYCQANYTDHAWDAIGEATLKEFRPSHVRIALPMKLRKMRYEIIKGPITRNNL